MRSLLFFISISLVSFSSVFAQKSKIDKKLETKIQAVFKDFEGVAGIYVRNLKTGKEVLINADTLFPTASLIKVPIMVGVFDKINRGELSYQQELIYRDSLHYDDGIVGSWKDGAKIPLSEVVMLMETVSDNTGSLWLQGLVGGEKINDLLENYGFRYTRVNSRVKGRESNRSQFGWGQTTPKEMATLMMKIRIGEIISPDASDRMYRNLGRQFWDGEGLSQLPESVKTACKTGAVNRSRSELTFVHAPHGEYVFCIITKNQKDESWERNNAGFALIRKVSATIWQHFEPKSTWKPVEAYEKWW